MREYLTTALSDRYDILHELGRGGMATVWLATDRKHQKSVAIKVLAPELARAMGGADRFLREVRVTATLEHPHIVRLIDSGEIPGPGGMPLPWYVMPHIPGESLRARMAREGPIEIEEAIRITEALASALAAAHARGIVHRDVKPENVMLSDGHVYLADFGIAQALHDTGVTKLTNTGTALGTLSYMSPEQASADEVDHRSDQYSLACVLYEMLTGETPFTGRTPQAIVARRMAEAARSTRTLRPAVPAALDAAILRALERVPADRFPDVRAFARALREAPTTGPRYKRWRAVPIPVVGAFAVLGVIAYGLLSKRSGGASEVPRSPEVVALYERAVRAYDDRTPEGIVEAVGSLQAALAIDSTYASAWARLGMAYSRAQERAFPIAGLTTDSILRLAVRAADRAIALDANEADAWVTRAIVGRVLDPADVRPAIEDATRALALDSTRANAWHVLALSQAESGDMDAARVSWEGSVGADPTYTQGLAFLGLYYYWTGRSEVGLPWADSAVAVDPLYYTGRTTVGEIASEVGDQARAEASFEAARLLATGVETVNNLAYRARVAARTGDRAGAERLLAEAEETLGSYLPLPLHTAAFIAEAHAVLGHADAAVDWASRFGRPGNLHYQLHLRCDPAFRNVETDPRFQALLVMPRPIYPATC